MGLLGALERLPIGEPPPWKALRVLVLDESAHAAARGRAASLLFRRRWIGKDGPVEISRQYTDGDITVLRRLIHSNRITGVELGHLIRGLREQPEVLKRLLPVFASAVKSGGNWGARRDLYESILALEGDTSVDERARLRAIGAALAKDGDPALADVVEGYAEALGTTDGTSEGDDR